MRIEPQDLPSASDQLAVLGVTITTMKRIMSQPKPADLIALYCFLAMHAHRQRTSRPYTTANFIARGLGWSESKVKRVKERLRDLGLIEPVVRRDEKSGRIEGHYVRVRYLVRRGMQNFVDPPEGHFTTSGEMDPKCLVIEAKLRGTKSTSIFRGSENRPKSFADVIEFVFTKIEPKIDAALVARWMDGQDWDQPPRKLIDALDAEGREDLSEKIQLAAIWVKRNEDYGWKLTDWRAALKGFSAKCEEGFGGIGMPTKKWIPTL